MVSSADCSRAEQSSSVCLRARLAATNARRFRAVFNNLQLHQLQPVRCVWVRDAAAGSGTDEPPASSTVFTSFTTTPCRGRFRPSTPWRAIAASLALVQAQCNDASSASRAATSDKSQKRSRRPCNLPRRSFPRQVYTTPINSARMIYAEFILKRYDCAVDSWLAIWQEDLAFFRKYW